MYKGEGKINPQNHHFWGCLLLLVFVQALVIFGEPSLEHPLPLLDHFTDSPEGGESEDTKEDREVCVAYGERTDPGSQADHQERPP